MAIRSRSRSQADSCISQLPTTINPLHTNESKHNRHRALQVRLQRRHPIQINPDSLHKRLRNQVRPRGASMGMVQRIERIRRRVAQLQIHVPDRLEMIDIARPLPDILGRARRIGHKARRGRVVGAPLPHVVGRLAADDDLCALGDEFLGRRLDVVVERVDSLACQARRAHLAARAGAVAAAVVRSRVGRAAVVVAELDDDDVVGLDEALDFREAPFVGVAAR